jgi:integrase
MPPSKHPELVKRLLSVLPARFSVYGQGTVLPVLKKALEKADICLNPDGKLVGLPLDFWNEVFTKLSIDENGTHQSRETRRRHSKILKEIAKTWLGQGWIEKVPDLKPSSQHPRRLTVRADQLGTYRFSDYLQVIEKFIQILSGKLEGSLVPQYLQSNLDAFLALALIFGGVCRENAMASLEEFRFEDLIPSVDWPLHLPSNDRKRFAWFWLLAPIRMLFEAARLRTGRCTGLIFKTEGEELRNQTRDLLSIMCTLAGVRQMNLEQMVYLARLHLRQAVPDSALGVWLGLIPFRPRPSDQLGLTPTVLDFIPVAANGMTRVIVSDQSQPNGDSDQLLNEYGRLLDEIWADITILFQTIRPKVAVERLQAWRAEQSQISQIPGQNLAWLVGWLISMVDNKKIKPQSRKVYWQAAKRIWKRTPALRLEEISEEDVEDFVTDEDYSLSSKRLSMRNWKELMNWMKKQGIQTSVHRFPQVPGKVDGESVRVLSPDDQTRLLQSLDNPTDQWAAFLAQKGSLRVSEVCKLVIGDFNLGPEPYIIVAKSKGGKSRRVSLEHLTLNQISALRQFIGNCKMRRGPRDFVFLDGQGHPLVAKNLSERIDKVLKSEGIQKEDQSGQPVTFHSQRRAGMNESYHRHEDIREAAQQGGHSLTMTTTGSYMSDLDLDGVEAMKKWKHPMNDVNLHIPLLLLAELIEREDRRVAQLVKEFNAAHKGQVTITAKNEELPDGLRPIRPGKPAKYISIGDALKLLIWINSKALPV